MSDEASGPTGDDERAPAVIVPHGRLSAEALTAVIEEFVTRDGTELTDAAVKIAAVRDGLDDGTLVLVYDPDSESCSVVPADTAFPEG